MLTLTRVTGGSEEAGGTVTVTVTVNKPPKRQPTPNAVGPALGLRQTTGVGLMRVLCSTFFNPFWATRDAHIPHASTPIESPFTATPGHITASRQGKWARAGPMARHSPTEIERPAS